MHEGVVLSVICPIYNCEDYVGELVQSFVDDANSPQVEVLFVNDCSTDASLQVCEQVLESNRALIRFRYRILNHAVNQGISAARTTGIKAATGQYLGFVDGDDVVLKGYSTHIFTALEKTSLPILEFTYQEFRDPATLQRRLPPQKEVQTRSYSGRDRHITLFKHGFFVWTRIYRRDVVSDSMLSTDRRSYEDISFTLDAFARAEGIYWSDLPLIGYRKREGSVTAVRTGRFIEQYAQLTEAMKRNRASFSSSLDLELRYVFKLVIILLKGFRIQPPRERLEFYRRIIAGMHRQSLAISPLSVTVSRSITWCLLCVSKALPR